MSNLIRFDNVSFSYGSNRVLDGIDLEIREGEFLAVLGYNGSGKSTMAKLINGILLPTEGKVIISVNKKDRKTIVPIARALQEMGFSLAATRGTARDLFEEGVLTDVVLKTHDGHPNIVDMLRHHRVDLVINTPMGFHSRRSDDEIRSEAMRNKVPYTTTTSAASAVVEAIRYLRRQEHIVRELPDRK